MIRLAAALLFFTVIFPAFARVSHSVSGTYHSRAARGVARNRKGHIRRSAIAKHEFERQHPCPSTGRTGGRCPGYVVDHRNPLECGGSDTPSNMQWQTKEAAKAKDFKPLKQNLKRFIALVEKDSSKASLFANHFIFELKDAKWGKPSQV